MCGIAGFSRLTPRTRFMANILAWEIDQRGRDSWGATDGKECVRFLGEVWEGWNGGDAIPAHWEKLILHTRAASNRQTVTAELTHPYEFATPTGHNLIGVHNGVLSNHKELNEKHSRTFEIDSMHLFANLAEGVDMQEVYGWGAVVWSDFNMIANKPVIHFTKFNMTDFYVYQLESGEVVFCSYDEAIKKAALMAGTAVKTKYTLGMDEWFFIDTHKDDPTRDTVFTMPSKMRFGYRHQPTQNVQYYSSPGTNNRALPVQQGVYTFGDEYDYGGSDGWYGSLHHPNLPPPSQDGTVLLDRRATPKRPKSIALDKIGCVKRDNNVCMACGHGYANRKVTLICDGCKVIFDTREYPVVKTLRSKANKTPTNTRIKMLDEDTTTIKVN
jgi:hypothetical protein